MFFFFLDKDYFKLLTVFCKISRLISRVQLYISGNDTGEVAQLSKKLLGPWAELIAKLFSFIILLGANIVYWILMSNFLYYSVGYIHGKTRQSNKTHFAHKYLTVRVKRNYNKSDCNSLEPDLKIQVCWAMHGLNQREAQGFSVLTRYYAQKNCWA